MEQRPCAQPRQGCVLVKHSFKNCSFKNCSFRDSTAGAPSSPALLLSSAALGAWLLSFTQGCPRASEPFSLPTSTRKKKAFKKENQWCLNSIKRFLASFCGRSWGRGLAGGCSPRGTGSRRAGCDNDPEEAAGQGWGGRNGSCLPSSGFHLLWPQPPLPRPEQQPWGKILLLFPRPVLR